MEDIKKTAAEYYYQEQKEKSFIDFQMIYRTLVLNWYWFILSIVICAGAAAIYLRYTIPTYNITGKLLIKESEQNRPKNVQSIALGTISNASGIDNEIEILLSRSLSKEVIQDLKLYTTYAVKGRVASLPSYGNQPLNVELDERSIKNLNQSIQLTIKRNGLKYNIEGSHGITHSFSTLPTAFNTRVGRITITTNNGNQLTDGEELIVNIDPVNYLAAKYASALQIAPYSKSTTILSLQMIDAVPQRAIDYLKHLVVVYNRQANEDKNNVALRTDSFLNERLAKISGELTKTEEDIQHFKQKNGMVELQMSGSSSFAKQSTAETQLAEMEVQIELFNNIADEANKATKNLSHIIPSNIGLNDGQTSTLIEKYNTLVLERNRLLRSASESSPVVEPLTEQIRTLNKNIRTSITTARKNLEIQRNGILEQFDKFNTEVAEAPQQERKLKQIGRQQEIKSELYLMLLQKREENSITLAATANKGRLIDEPQTVGKVSPNSQLILGGGALAGLIIPAFILFLIQFFRYKIEGHEDVRRLTTLPVLADIPVASNTAKGKADIVVHENQNNQMEEVFRSMRTNLQFMMKENEKVILFTSSTSGEGKTFTASNLAVSFALLSKKVVLVGLDIRRPRLAELFKIKDHKHGITNLLMKDEPTIEDIKGQILNSGVNPNLDLLMAGPIPPNPAELIARSSLEMIFNILKTEYDYIIIDTAPVGLVTDTLQVGRVANATVYLCRADYTPKAAFEMINMFSSEKKLPKMSLVLNGIDMSKKKYGYYYGYGNYGKYGKYGYGKGKYGGYGSYGSYGTFETYGKSHYGNKHDDSIKR